MFCVIAFIVYILCALPLFKWFHGMNVTNLIAWIPCRSAYIIKMDVYPVKCFVGEEIAQNNRSMLKYFSRCNNNNNNNKHNKICKFLLSFVDVLEKFWTSYTAFKALQLHYSFKMAKSFWGCPTYLYSAYFECLQKNVRISEKAYVSFLDFPSKIPFHYNSYIIVLHITSLIHFILFLVGLFFFIIYTFWLLFFKNSFCQPVYWEHINTFFIVIIFRL